MLRYCSSAGLYCQQNTIIAGSEHFEHARVSAGLVPLTLKFHYFRYISITLNWLVILLSSLNCTTYVLFF